MTISNDALIALKKTLTQRIEVPNDAFSRRNLVESFVGQVILVEDFREGTGAGTVEETKNNSGCYLLRNNGDSKLYCYHNLKVIYCRPQRSPIL